MNRFARLCIPNAFQGNDVIGIVAAFTFQHEWKNYKWSSGILAKRMGLDTKEVYQDFADNVIDGIQPVPTGVWALGEVQAKGCGYIFAG